MQVMVPDVVMVQSKFDNVFEKIDLSLLNRVLRIFVHPYTPNYIATKNNITVHYATYKCYGIIRGLQFASFICQCFAELEQKPELKATETENKAQDELEEKFKESGAKEKFFNAEVTKDAKDLKEYLEQGDTKNVEHKFDKGTQSTVQFIRLVPKTRQNTIQSSRTVLIQRISEYEVKQDASQKLVMKAENKHKDKHKHKVVVKRKHINNTKCVRKCVFDATVRDASCDKAWKII